MTLARARATSDAPWTRTDAIQQGRGINRIRIVCVDDYLALYVNGQFVAEARDSLFASGYAGLTAAVPEGGEVDVRFDDLVIRAATGSPASPLISAASSAGWSKKGTSRPVSPSLSNSRTGSVSEATI